MPYLLVAGIDSFGLDKKSNMKILFIRGHSSFSNLICSVTQEDISHVALCITLEGSEFVIHSDLRGLHIETLEAFSKRCEVVYTLEKQSSPEDTKQALKVLSEHEWSYYDLGAIAFLGLCLTVRRYLRIPLPKSNLWQTTGMFMCVEWLSYYIDLKEESMCTPKRLYYIMLGRPEWS